MSEIEILEQKLLGNFYTRISIGDTFDLYFEHFWLVSQNVVCSDEDFINKDISGYRSIKEAVDKEDIAKCVVLTATLRKKVTSVILNTDSSLELLFENGVRLRFTTNNEVVDWQWAINENGGDPYLDFVIGVLDSGCVQFDHC